MTNKTTLKRLKLDPYFSKTIETNLNVWSHDVNSFEIKFEFYNHECDKPIDLTGADMRILLDHADSQPKVYPLEIESKILGLAKFVMPKEIRGCEGKFTAHIYADYPNKTHDFGNFIFYTQLSRIDKGMGGCLDTVYVSEFEKALQDIKDKRNQFEGVQKDLNERIDVIEKDIASNEIAKQSDVEKLNKSINSYEVSRRNLIDKEKVISGLWINEDGTENTPVKNAFTTDFIEVKNGYEYTTTQKHLRLHTVMCVSAYDKDKNFVKRLADSNDQFYTFVINDNRIKYIRYSGKSPTSNYEDGIKVEESSIATYWLPSPEDVVIMQKDIENLKKAITTLGGTL